MPERDATEYQAVIALRVVTEDRDTAVEQMTAMLKSSVEDLDSSSFGVADDHEGEDADVLTRVPGTLDADHDETETGRLSFWSGTHDNEGEWVDSLDGVFKVMLTFHQGESESD